MLHVLWKMHCVNPLSQSSPMTNPDDSSRSWCESFDGAFTGEESEDESQDAPSECDLPVASNVTLPRAHDAATGRSGSHGEQEDAVGHIICNCSSLSVRQGIIESSEATGEPEYGVDLWFPARNWLAFLAPWLPGTPVRRAGEMQEDQVNTMWRISLCV
jgi:hypothetical protein